MKKGILNDWMWKETLMAIIVYGAIFFLWGVCWWAEAAEVAGWNEEHGYVVQIDWQRRYEVVGEVCYEDGYCRVVE